MIFQRAIRREFTHSAAGVFVALFAILLTTQLIRFLGQAAQGSIAPEAVVALLGRDDDEEAAAAAEDAISWLLAEQEDDGSFGGGVVGAQDDPVPNANSTGLAG